MKNDGDEIHIMYFVIKITCETREKIKEKKLQERENRKERKCMKCNMYV